MRITKIHMADFRQFENKVVPLFPITRISGFHRMGKSTIGEAPIVALLGTTIDGRERGLPTARLLRNGAAAGSVGIEAVTDHGESFHLFRNFRAGRQDVQLNGRRLSTLRELHLLLGVFAEPEIFLSLYRAGYFLTLGDTARRGVARALLPQVDPEDLMEMQKSFGPELQTILQELEAAPLSSEVTSRISSWLRTLREKVQGRETALKTARALLELLPPDEARPRPLPAQQILDSLRQGGLLHTLLHRTRGATCFVCKSSLPPGSHKTQVEKTREWVVGIGAHYINQERRRIRNAVQKEVGRVEERMAEEVAELARLERASSALRHYILQISSLQLMGLELPDGTELQLLEERKNDAGEMELQDCCRLRIGGLDHTCHAESIQIQAGYELSKALRRAAGFHLPIWVDRLESCRLPLALEPQTILSEVASGGLKIREVNPHEPQTQRGRAAHP